MARNTRATFFMQNSLLKPILTRSQSFSRASLSVSFDWLLWLFLFFVICYSDYYGFGFPAPNQKATKTPKFKF